MLERESFLVNIFQVSCKWKEVMVSGVNSVDGREKTLAVDCKNGSTTLLPLFIHAFGSVFPYCLWTALLWPICPKLMLGK